MIEILVLVAIIGVLAAITIPAISSIRIKAQGGKCANNLRQIGVAFSLYLPENQNKYPSKGVAGDRWVHRVGVYLTEQTGAFGSATWDHRVWSLPVFRCPLTPPTTYAKPSSSTGCYGYNGNIAERAALSITAPAKTVLLAEKNYRAGIFGDTGASGPMLFTTPTVPMPYPQDYQGAAANHRSDGLPAKGGDGLAHYLFADGHVESILSFPQATAFNYNP